LEVEVGVRTSQLRLVIAIVENTLLAKGRRQVLGNREGGLSQLSWKGKGDREPPIARSGAQRVGLGGSRGFRDHAGIPGVILRSSAAPQSPPGHHVLELPVAVDVEP